MADKLPKIDIIRQIFLKIHIEANPPAASVSPTPAKIDVESNIELKELDLDSSMFGAISRVTCFSGDSPYRLEVEAYGEFRIGMPDADTDKRRIAAIHYAHQVLYSSVREMIHTVTARSANGPLNIGVSFLSINNVAPATPVEVKAPKRKTVATKKKARS